MFTGPKKVLGIIPAPETIKCWLGVACCVSHPIRLKDSLISNKTGKNQLISLIFAWKKSRESSIKTTTLGWVYPDVPLGHSDSRIL